MLCSSSHKGLDECGSRCVSVGLELKRAGKPKDISPKYSSLLLPCCTHHVIDKELERRGDLTREKKAWMRDRHAAFRKDFSQVGTIVCSTCAFANASPVLEVLEHNVVLIDETGQACEPEVIIPVERLRSHPNFPASLISAGDHKQLPPQCESQAERDVWQFNLLERLFCVSGMSPVMLDTHSISHAS
jgi:superfamily I DNA and/or RNA helicase